MKSKSTKTTLRGRMSAVRCCVMGLLGLMLAPLPGQAKTKETYSLQGRKVLFVYGGWEGHAPVPCRDLLVPWMREEGAEVTVSDNLDIYTDKEKMASFDLIIQIWTMGSITGEQENGLLEAVRNGAGLAGWHGGLGDAFRNNTEYQFMVGGQWVAHPGGPVDYDVNITDHRDPVTKGLKTFHMHSEQYYMHVDPNVKVLATTTYNGKIDPWIDGCVMPVAWKKMYGKGRVFYSSLWHDEKDFDVPESVEIIKRGIRWAAQSKYEGTENLVRPVY